MEGGPRIGIFSLSSCEGCLVHMLALGGDLLEVLGNVRVTACRILGVRDDGGGLDVAIVEGSVMSEEEEERLREIRRRSRILVALGDCACHGGRFVVKDFGVERIDIDLPRGVRGFRSDPLDKHVRVDYYLYGCPADKEEILTLFKDIMLGRAFKPKGYNVCSECILRENECLLDAGVACLGPITRGGCRALCPSFGRECIGCRGLAEDANIDSLVRTMRERGIEPPDHLMALNRAVRERT